MHGRVHPLAAVARRSAAAGVCGDQRGAGEGKGIANGEKVRISSARGTVDAVAMVTVRLTPFKCGGKTVHQVGMTFNYGWLQPKECGDTANLLSPMVGDANSMTPEYKAFMVNIDKIKA